MIPHPKNALKALTTMTAALLLTITLSGTTPRDPVSILPAAIPQTDDSRTGCSLQLEAGTIDFGTTYEDARLRHSLLLTNTGTTPVEIVDVSTSCGCTTVDTQMPFMIPPSGSGQITLQLSTANTIGPLEKRVTLFAKQNGAGFQYPVSLKAVSSPLVEVSDRHVDFGMVPLQESHTRSLSVVLNHIHQHTDATLRVISVPRGIRAAIQRRPATRGEARRWEVRLSAEGDSIPPEAIDGDVVLQTPSTVEEFVRIPVRARQHSFLSADVARVHFGAIRPGSSETRTVRLKCVDGHHYHITSIKMEGAASLQTEHVGDALLIRPAANMPPGFFRATLQIGYSCDKGRQQLLSIPVTGYCLAR